MHESSYKNRRIQVVGIDEWVKTDADPNLKKKNGISLI